MGSLADFVSQSLGISREYAFLFVGFFLGVLLTAVAKRGQSSPLQSGTTNGSMGEMGSAVPSGAFMKAEVTSSGNLSINGQSLSLGGETLAEIRQLLMAGNKIEAIKKLRVATSLDLVTAKAVTESLENALRLSGSAHEK